MNQRQIQLRCALLAAGMLMLATAGCADKTTAKAPSPPSRTTVASGDAVQSPSSTQPGDADTSQTGQQEVQASADAPVQEPALFDGWPQPDFVLLVSGRQHGYIEPCGCTGLENQKGGLARRHTFRKQLQQRGWDVVPLDVGNQVRRFGRQPEIKFQFTAHGLEAMGYQAIGFGPDDLQLSATEFLSLEKSPFVCANAAVIDRSLTPRYRVATVGEKKVGVTAILGAAELRAVQSSDILSEPPEQGLQVAWPLLKEENCDLYVLLAHASDAETRQLAQQFPHFDIVITAGGSQVPLYQPEKIEQTESILVEVGEKGMYAGVIGVFSKDDGQRPELRYQRVPLDSRFEDSPDMLELLHAYQKQLESFGLEELGLTPIPHPSGREFVGSDTCADCHEEQYNIWKGTGHAKATHSLTNPNERVDIPRHFDPECLSCHVTGWNPQKYYPYKSGYLSLADTLLHNNGCENCHGPGSRHVAAQNGDVDATEKELELLREQMRLPLAKAHDRCIQCHDVDNSPDFHADGAFEEFLERIKHW